MGGKPFPLASANVQLVSSPKPLRSAVLLPMRTRASSRLRDQTNPMMRRSLSYNRSLNHNLNQSQSQSQNHSQGQSQSQSQNQSQNQDQNPSQANS